MQRDYEAFEKLQKDLSLQFPQIKLPMPRKYFLFMSDDDLEDRRVSFDCLLTVIAMNKELCTCIPVLIFLGIDLLADRKYAKRRKAYLKKTSEDATTSNGSEVKDDEDLFSDEKKNVDSKPTNDDDEDLFKDPPKDLQMDSEGELCCLYLCNYLYINTLL